MGYICHLKTRETDIFLFMEIVGMFNGILWNHPSPLDEERTMSALRVMEAPTRKETVSMDLTDSLFSLHKRKSGEIPSTFDTRRVTEANAWEV